MRMIIVKMVMIIMVIVIECSCLYRYWGINHNHCLHEITTGKCYFAGNLLHCSGVISIRV